METITRYRIRYTPGTDLHARFPDLTAADWPLAEAREVLRACPNADRMELVPA